MTTSAKPKPTKGRIERNVAFGSTYRWQPRTIDITLCNIFVAAAAASLTGLPNCPRIFARFFRVADIVSLRQECAFSRAGKARIMSWSRRDAEAWASFLSSLASEEPRPCGAPPAGAARLYFSASARNRYE